jgi:DNA end-binding protein Ku
MASAERCPAFGHHSAALLPNTRDTAEIMRSIWNGTISFGLVSIPVKLYAAVDSQRVGFKLLCKPCMTPVRYERYCDGCEDKIDWNDTVKAIDLGSGNYLPFSREELDAIKPEKTDRIEIEEIIDGEKIDPIQYNKPYFCAPSSARERSYHLFKRVLEDANKVAVGRFVMREKEYVCAIRPFKSGLLLSTLHYAYEVRDIDSIDALADAPELKKDEVELAERLVDQLYEEEFDINQFKDRFADQLRTMIDSKEKITIETTESEAPVFDESSLMEALKASLN